MKATELMCGDLVLHEGKPMRVYGTMERMNRVYDTMTNDISPKYLSPIPLTAEILEKNGFWFGLTTEQEDIMECGLGVPVTPQKSWVWENEDDAVVCVDFPNENDGGQVWCNNHEKTSTVVWKNNFSVHELQHALCLCGLNELADNFKID